MITFQNVTKLYGTQEVLRDVSLQINPSESIGIVGPNGAGKSTLFRLITGEEDSEAGRIDVLKSLRIGYLRQQVSQEDGANSLLDVVLEGVRDVFELEQTAHDLQDRAAASSNPAERDDLLRQAGEAQHQFEDRGGYSLSTRAETVLSGLGFHVADFAKPFDTFSGGWQMRGQLARTLIAQPDVLLLDEPSNYLDVPAIDWLQRYLANFPGTLLLISHDRYLLSSLVRDIVEVNKGRVTRYSGGFAKYEVERVARYERYLAEQKNLLRKREQLERFIDRFRSKATKATQVQSRVKQLDKMDEVDEVQMVDAAQLIRLPPPPHCGHEIIQLNQLGHSYDEERWLFRDLNLSLERKERVAVVGYNGMGKSTLLKILAGQLEPKEGNVALGHQVLPGYQSQDFADTMPVDRSAYGVLRDAAPRELNEQDIRAILGGFGFSGDAIEKPTGVLSGGEKIRLAFARIFVDPPNVLILDEPTTHLDIAGRETLETALRQYEGTVLLVIHDITFVKNVADRIWAITEHGLQTWPGGYDYFIEKTGGLQSVCAEPAGKETAAPASSVSGVSGLSGKARKEAQRKLRALERQVSSLEEKIAGLEATQASVLDEMQDPNAPFNKLNKQLESAVSDSKKLQEQWEMCELEAEELREALGGARH